jgi:hypothetical protein
MASVKLAAASSEMMSRVVEKRYQFTTKGPLNELVVLVEDLDLLYTMCGSDFAYITCISARWLIVSDSFKISKLFTEHVSTR